MKKTAAKTEQRSATAEAMTDEEKGESTMEEQEGLEPEVSESTEANDPRLVDNDTLEDEGMRLFGGKEGQKSAESRGPSLEEQLQAANALVEEHRNASLRAVAEMQNVRKRFERESQQARQFAVEGFARDLLMVADNLDRALAAVPAECSNELKMFGEGVAMTQNELNRAFNKHGVTRLESLGAAFDPHLHQAVLQVEEAGAQPGTVVKELQPGYLLNGRLLRPAMVGVAKEMEPPVQEAESEAVAEAEESID